MQDLVSENIKELGQAGLVDVLDQLVDVKGKKLLDVGCGGGRLASLLVERGATVIGVEPDPVQAEKNRNAELVPGLTFVEAGGEKLPVEDQSVDGVFYRYSLHHVPGEVLEAALLETVRVLKPETGFLYVVEPLLTGTMQAVYTPFHDETFVRTRAYETLQSVLLPRFEKHSEYRYGEMVRHESFEAFRARTLGLTYNEIDGEGFDQPIVREKFEVGKTDEGYLFDRYNRVNLFQGPKAG